MGGKRRRCVEGRGENVGMKRREKEQGMA